MDHEITLLHAMLPVRDLQRSLHFYCQLLGLQELRRICFADSGRILVFLGHPTATAQAMQIELWFESDDAPVAQAHPAGHIGISVTEIDQFVATLVAAGVVVDKLPAPIRVGGRKIALVRDPDGHQIELLANA